MSHVVPALPDCLVVLETLGVRSTAAILGICAFRFDIDDPFLPHQELTIAIDPESNSVAGRTMETSAMQWWAERPDIGEVFGRDGYTLHTALEQLQDFFGDAEQLWTTAGGYEVAMLADAFSHFGLRTPWPYWQVVCGRTLCNLSAWISSGQVTPSAYGPSLLETARLRLLLIRGAYKVLKGRKYPQPYDHRASYG